MAKTYRSRLGFVLGSTVEWCKDSWHEYRNLKRSLIVLTPMVPIVAFRYAGDYKDPVTGEYVLHKSEAAA